MYNLSAQCTYGKDLEDKEDKWRAFVFCGTSLSFSVSEALHGGPLTLFNLTLLKQTIDPGKESFLPSHGTALYPGFS